jgi:hypothetical protein
MEDIAFLNASKEEILENATGEWSYVGTPSPPVKVNGSTGR